MAGTQRASGYTAAEARSIERHSGESTGDADDCRLLGDEGLPDLRGEIAAVAAEPAEERDGRSRAADGAEGGGEHEQADDCATAERAGAAILHWNYFPTRFAGRPRVLSRTFERRGRLSIPFSKADFTGIAFL